MPAYRRQSTLRGDNGPGLLPEHRAHHILRRIAGRINVLLASGGHFSNWRAGYTNVSPLDVYSVNFNVQFPALGTLVGANTFYLITEDVTPPPYNHPPYPMAGGTCTDSTVVTGIAP